MLGLACPDSFTFFTPCIQAAFIPCLFCLLKLLLVTANIRGPPLQQLSPTPFWGMQMSASPMMISAYHLHICLLNPTTLSNLTYLDSPRRYGTISINMRIRQVN